MGLYPKGVWEVAPSALKARAKSSPGEMWSFSGVPAACVALQGCAHGLGLDPKGFGEGACSTLNARAETFALGGLAHGLGLYPKRVGDVAPSALKARVGFIPFSRGVLTDCVALGGCAQGLGLNPKGVREVAAPARVVESLSHWGGVHTGLGYTRNGLGRLPPARAQQRHGPAAATGEPSVLERLRSVSHWGGVHTG